MPKKRDAEDRLQQRLRKLGTENPICVCCGESYPFALEQHHIAGQKHSDDLAIVCANCHRKLSDQQRDHVPPGSGEPEGLLAKIGHFLLGLADLLALAVDALRNFGRLLIEMAIQGSAT